MHYMTGKGLYIINQNMMMIPVNAMTPSRVHRRMSFRNAGLHVLSCVSCAMSRNRY